MLFIIVSSILVLCDFAVVAGHFLPLFYFWNLLKHSVCTTAGGIQKPCVCWLWFIFPHQPWGFVFLAMANSTYAVEEISTSKGYLAKWMTFHYSRWNWSHNLGNTLFLVWKTCWGTGTLLLGLRSQTAPKVGSWLPMLDVGAIFRAPFPGLDDVLCNTGKMNYMHFIG